MESLRNGNLVGPYNLLTTAAIIEHLNLKRTCDTAGLNATFFSRVSTLALSSRSFVRSLFTLKEFEVNCVTFHDSCDNSNSNFSGSVVSPVQISSA